MKSITTLLIGFIIYCMPSVALSTPVNDACSNAIALGISPQTITGTTVDATPDALAAASCFVAATVDYDVWYTFTTGSVTTAHQFTIKGIGADPLYAPEFAIYSGTCGSLTEVFCQSSNPNSLKLSAVAPGLSANTTYYLRIDSHTSCGLAETGEFELSISSFEEPLTLSTTHTFVQAGDQIAMDVTVANFDLITGLQFSMDWDPTILQFQGFNNTSIIIPSNIGTTNTANGSLNIAWFDFVLSGQSLPDGTVLFQIIFDVIGLPGQVSPFNFSTAPLPKEAFNNNLQALQILTNNGSVTIVNELPLQLMASHEMVITNTGVCLDISTNDFNALTNVQHSFGWDPTLLHFTGVQSFNLPNLDNSHFDETNTNGGQLAFDWDADNNTPVSLPDGTSLYQICFDAIGPGGSSPVLSFSNTPLPLAATRSNTAPVSINTTNGTVHIMSQMEMYIKAPNLQVLEGEMFSIEVTVEEFMMIASAQFSMDWDPAIIEFQSIQPQLTGLDLSSFNLSNVANGNLSLSWFDPNAAGVSLMNESSIFTLIFKATGLPNSQTTIAFSSTPTPIEVVNGSANPLLVNTVNGDITILSQSGGLSINGNIHLEDGTFLENTQVDLSGDVNSMQQTAADGNYTFSGLPSGSKLSLSPSKDDAIASCVTVHDINAIARHILGSSQLSSPYKMIAADVNGSGSITSLDLVIIRQVILGIRSDFPIGSSYRFIPDSHIFNNPNNPFLTPIPSTVEIDNLISNQTADFTAVKMGDVTGCPGGTPFFTVKAANYAFNTGQTASIDITVKDFISVAGLQTTLSFDPNLFQLNQIYNLNPALSNFSLNNFNTQLATSGLIPFAWDGFGSPYSLPDNAVLFTIELTAIGPCGSGPLSFIDNPVPTEGIDQDFTSRTIVKMDGNLTIINSCNTFTLEIPDQSVCADQIIRVPVKVMQFENIQSLQFSMDWDPAILHFMSIENLNIAEPSNSLFNTALSANGILTFSWFSADANGVNLPDQTAIFELEFKVIAPVGQFSNISFKDAPTVIEVSKSNGLQVNPMLKHGLINIGSTPIALCQNATVLLDMNGTATLFPADIDNGSGDSCGSVDLTLSQTQFTCADVGTKMISLTATNSIGNTSVCQADITVMTNNCPIVAGKLFWSVYDGANTTIMTAELDGSSPQAIRTEPGFIWSMDIDLNHLKIYWANNATDDIKRANFDGSNIETIYSNTDPFSNPDGLVLDLKMEKLYWQVYINGNSSIVQANLDGSDLQVIHTESGFIWSMDIDPVVGKIYFANNGSDDIKRINTDGTNLEVLYTNPNPLGNPFANPDAVILDLKHSKLYWVVFDGNNSTIMRAALDGSAMTSIHTEVGVIWALDIDPVNEQIYWSNNGTDAITKADLDGSNRQIIFSTPVLIANPDAVTVCKSSPNVAAFSNGPICPNEDLLLSENGGDAACWSWTGPNNFSSTLQNPVISNADDQQAGTYSVEIKDAWGHMNTATINNPILLADVEITNIQVDHESCAHANDGSAMITATAPPGAQLFYSVDGGINFNLTGVFEYLNDGQYDVVVVAHKLNLCTATATATMIINPGDTPQIWYKDLDNDGYTDGIHLTTCTPPPGYKLTALSGDCDDNDPDAFPGQIWYKDLDNDGYTDGQTISSCQKPIGYSLHAQTGDCNDDDSNIHPSATETCNGLDDNCDGQIDEGIFNATYQGDVTILSQSQLDDWPTCYTSINGNLTISGNAIVDLTALSNLTNVTGTVSIYFSALSTLNGLEQLNVVGGSFIMYYNFSLTDCCAVADLLDNGGVSGTVVIFFNTTNCNSQAAISNTCNPAPPIITNPQEVVQATMAPYVAPSKSLLIYPNPASNLAFIALEHKIEKGWLRVLDNKGQTVLKRHFNEVESKEIRLVINRWAPGVYWIQAHLDGINYSNRLVVEP